MVIALTLININLCIIYRIVKYINRYIYLYKLFFVFERELNM